MSVHVAIPTPPHDSTKYLNGDMAWTVPPGGGGGGAVDSVFGRTGVVVATAGDYGASAITNTPAGGISATNVQSALNELDSEKLAVVDFSYTGLDDIPANLTAIANLVSAADKLPYFTGTGTAAVTDLTTAGRALLDDANAAAQRTTLGLGSVENTALSTWAGSTNLTTLGTITTGTWNATALTQAKSHGSPDTDSAATALHHTLGTGANQACAGNDSRLSDSRTPTAHAASHKNGGSDEIATATAAANAIPKAGAGGTLDIGWVPTGTSSTTVCVGNDSRLSDARTPTTHATSHKSGGSDPIKLDELAAPTDITTLNASTSAHGLLPKLDNNSAHFLDGQGNWSTPTASTGLTTRGDILSRGASSDQRVALGYVGAIVGSDGVDTVYSAQADVSRYFCDFIDGAPGWTISNSGTGASSSIAAGPSDGVVGCIVLNCGTTTTGKGYIQQSATGLTFGGAKLILRSRIWISALSDVTDTYVINVGFGDGFSSASHTDGVFFSYASGTSANWLAFTKNNGSSTQASGGTNVAVAAGAWVNLTIEVSAGASPQADFYVNGTLIGSSSTNIPKTSGRETGFGAVIFKSAGTNARTLNIDFFEIVAIFSSSRVSR